MAPLLRPGRRTLDRVAAAEDVGDLLAALGRDRAGRAHAGERGEGRLDHVVRVGGAQALADTALIADRSQAGAHRPPAEEPVPGRAGRSRQGPAPELPKVAWGRRRP